MTWSGGGGGEERDIKGVVLPLVLDKLRNAQLSAAESWDKKAKKYRKPQKV